MKTLTFKTNVMNSDGVAAVMPLLNAVEPLDGFNLKTSDPHHLLTVQTVDNRIGGEVIRAVEKAGDKAELLNNL